MTYFDRKGEKITPKKALRNRAVVFAVFCIFFAVGPITALAENETDTFVLVSSGQARVASKDLDAEARAIALFCARVC